MTISIAYLGPEATWSHQAARNHFGCDAHFIAQPSLSAVFHAVSQADSDFGIVPIENSTEGFVSQTLDLFPSFDLQIQTQFLLRIENVLLARSARSEIRRVYSHPQALGQCREWLRREMKDVAIRAVSSTARAAQLAAQEAGAAAIASRFAAEIYDVPIVASAIQDQKDNTTRFLLLGRESAAPCGEDRTSLLFGPGYPSDKLPGILHLLHQMNITLTNLQTRPAQDKAWQYFFFLELAGHHQDKAIASLLDRLRLEDETVRMLGSYAAAEPSP